MMDLIDRDKLIERLKIDAFYIPSYFMDVIKMQPTVDAVPVVRCKDCIHWGNKIKHGSFLDVKQCDFHGTRHENSYCSDGEKVQE